MSSNDVMTVEEVRRGLRLGRNAVYEAIRRGEIPSVRIGHRILIPRLAYQQMLNSAGNSCASIGAGE